jgi:isopentenyl-diphosphate delta-isomerase type 1
MNDEIFDIVDEHDRVVGQLSRGEVHRLGLMHRAVHVFVFNAAGQVFLQKRSLSKDRQPGLWDTSSSGHVDAGEDYDTCARREVREELGVTLENVPEKLFKLPASIETDWEHVWVYRTQWDGPMVLHPDEIDGGEWLAPEELTRRLQAHPENFATALLVIWPRLLATSE